MGLDLVRDSYIPMPAPTTMWAFTALYCRLLRWTLDKLHQFRASWLLLGFHTWLDGLAVPDWLHYATPWAFAVRNIPAYRCEFDPARARVVEPRVNRPFLNKRSRFDAGIDGRNCRCPGQNIGQYGNQLGNQGAVNRAQAEPANRLRQGQPGQPENRRQRPEPRPPNGNQPNREQPEENRIEAEDVEQPPPEPEEVPVEPGPDAPDEGFEEEGGGDIGWEYECALDVAGGAGPVRNFILETRRPGNLALEIRITLPDGNNTILWVRRAQTWFDNRIANLYIQDVAQMRGRFERHNLLGMLLRYCPDAERQPAMRRDEAVPANGRNGMAQGRHRANGVRGVGQEVPRQEAGRVARGRGRGRGVGRGRARR